MKYIIKAHKLEPETVLYGVFCSDSEMIECLTENQYLIRSYKTEDGKIIAGECLQNECLIKELKKETRKTKDLAKKVVISNGLITVGLILIAILSNLR